MGASGSTGGDYQLFWNGEEGGTYGRMGSTHRSCNRVFWRCHRHRLETAGVIIILEAIPETLTILGFVVAVVIVFML
jgi:hypothetical protein